jgi:RHS repeat-associated protein
MSYDGLGSVIALSDSNGNIVEQYKYDVFGKPTIMEPNDAVISSSAYDNPYMFTGRRYDEQTGLYYYRARYYSPDLGRFISADPIGYYDSLNLYQYCLNNPVNYIDPWGLCKEGLDYDNLSWQDWTRELTKGFFEGAWDGAKLSANGMTFGLLPNDWINRDALIVRYGNIGRASEICGGTATVCLTTAGILKATGTNIILEGPKGTRLFQMRWQKTGKPIFRCDKGHYHRIPDLSQHRPSEGGW